MKANGCEKLSDEWWVIKYEWWVMSDEWWKLSDGNWVMVFCCPNRLSIPEQKKGIIKIKIKKEEMKAQI